MEIESAKEKRLITVRVEGELDHHSAGGIREYVERELRRTGADSVAFDLSSMTFMDSSGIGLIMGRYKTVKMLGGRVIIFGASRETERILKMAGIDKIAEIY